jgi:glutamate-1-semialdehyde 2,1-aminomutase|tara:strand:+ start:150 stop:1439 length:1290 start_codon:yes stop_codon:yes gene_type:complete
MYLKSKKKFKESKKYLAGGVSSHYRLIFNPIPLTYKYAKGSKLIDIDDNKYIDYALGAGPLVLGHAPKEVISAVKKTLNDGQLYYGQHKTEINLAKKIIKIIPSAERVRFASSGSEATHAALRVSRGYTNRKIIIKFDGHYHGWFDNQYISVNPLSKNKKKLNTYGANLESIGQDYEAAKDVISLPWNNLDIFKKTIEKFKHNVAAVIMEPIMCNTCVILPQNGYLEEIREMCSKYKIVLIFDEVITGFRIKLGGAQEYLKIKPDLSIFAKGIASGFSLSCLTGKKQIMDEFNVNKVVHGGTYNSSVINTVAALKTIEIIENNKNKIFYKLNSYREQLTKKFLEIARKKSIDINIQGVGSIFHISFTSKKILKNYHDYQKTNLNKLKSFIEKMQNNNIRITGRGTWFISNAHSIKDMNETISSFKKSIK